MKNQEKIMQINKSVIKTLSISFIVVTCSLGCVGNNSKSVKIDEINVSEISISISELVAAYKVNKSDADLKFKNKTFNVNGVVEDVSDNYFVFFKNNDPYHSVLCYLNDSNSAKYIRRNTNVTLKGTCRGLLGSHVILKKCILVDAR